MAVQAQYPPNALFLHRSATAFALLLSLGIGLMVFGCRAETEMKTMDYSQDQSPAAFFATTGGLVGLSFLFELSLMAVDSWFFFFWGFRWWESEEEREGSNGGSRATRRRNGEFVLFATSATASYGGESCAVADSTATNFGADDRVHWSSIGV